MTLQPSADAASSDVAAFPTVTWRAIGDGIIGRRTREQI
jgi:hypothetical protein